MRTIAFVLLAIGLFIAAALLVFLTVPPRVEAPPAAPAKAPAAVPAPADPPAAEEVPPPPASPDAQAPTAPPAEAVEKEYKITYHGIVQQGADATPVAAAHIVFLDDDEVVAEAESDDTGAYRIEATLDNWDINSFALTCEAKGFSRVVKTAGDLGTKEAGVEIRYDFSLAPGSALTGRITINDSGAAVAEVKVQLRPRESGFNEERFRRRAARTATATSDDEGRYAFLSLPAGVFELSIDPGDKNVILTGTDSRMLNVAAASTQELDLVLEAGATVQGALTTSDGAEPEDAHVALKRDDQAQGMMKRIMEAAESMMNDRAKIEDGRYRIDRLRFSENYRLRAGADGYAHTQTESFSIPPGQSPLTLDIQLARGSSVSGVVKYSDGSSAPDQRVMLMPDLSAIMAGELPESDYSAKTDPQGAFTIAGIAPGKYSVMAGQPSFPFGKGDNSAEVELDGVNQVKDIVLEVGKPAARNTTPKDGAINGRVVDEKDTPVSNATVEAKIFGVNVKSVTTAEDGAFAITELDDVKYDLVARSDDGEGEAKQVSVGSEVTIKLAGATQVSGVVVDTAGEPVAQCGVRLEKQSADQSQLFDPEMFQNMMGMGGKGGATDEFGYFAFKHVGPGKYIVKAVASGRGSGESDLLEVQAGKSIDNLKITMQAGVLFTGTVVDSSGKGVDGAELALYMTSGGGMFQEQMAQFMPQEMQQATMSAFSEAQGAFSMQGVPPGPYRLGATHPQYARTVIKDLVFVAGHDLTNYTVTISAGGCLSGVPLLQGESRKGLMVQAIGDNGMEMTTTGEDGAFEICGLAPGRYIVHAMDMSAMMSGNFSAMMPVQRTAEVRENETTVVEFAAAEGAVAVTGTVSGEIGTMTTVTLRDPASPAPAELDPFDMAGQIEMMDQMGGNTLVSPDGTFTMENVKPGDYILEVYSFNFDMQAPNMQELMETARSPRLQQNVTIRAGEAPHFELEIPTE